MPLVSCFRQGGPLFLLALSLAVGADERRGLVDNDTAIVVGATGQCEARTINYITHTLPQLCLTSTWTSLATPATESPITSRPQATGIDGAEERVSPTAPAQADAFSEAITGDAVATPFMSFEDWKEMMLRRAGQDPQELRLRKSNEHKATDRSPPEMGDSGLGEEGEISLSFDNYPDREDEAGAGTHAHAHADTTNRDASGSGDSADEALVFKDGKATMHRSQDAGKTCKERFSYSSFDAGATILKAGPEAKNAKAILVENKDSYMLLECAARDKYVIVELSDDILIDTVVIANFEFFSSMIRHFRVSVSDRYPVKSEKWRDLGIFEAKNSRDIQPFLVQNPQIWAKYVRIEFLTHYGNEYYCPVSLLRVHGSRMLDSWKDIETGRDEEGLGEEDEEEIAPASLNHSQLTVVAAEPKPQELAGNSSDPVNTSPSPLWLDPFGQHAFFYQLTATCAASLVPPDEARSNGPESGPGLYEEGGMRQNRPPQPEEPAFASHGPPGSDEASTMPPSKQHPDSAVPSPDSRPAAPAESIDAVGAGGSGGSVANTSMLASKTTASAVVGGKGRNGWTTSAAAASPTVQEGFFNAITKRLQQVESNLTLSLQYIQDQSRHMQDVLQRTEQKQLSKLSHFLGDLNQTVLAELRNVRDQYDQMWQSTVLALESQREQSERDIVALSTRLNLLADEVVFQKRMAILQAVLLLSCLFLVIFSRGVPIPYLAPLQEPHLYKSSAAAQQGESMRLTLGLSPSHAGHRETTEYRQLSPPVTPGLQDDAMYEHMHVPPRDTQPSSLRRPASLHHSNSRKPLPSLPEHSVPTHGT